MVKTVTHLTPRDEKHLERMLIEGVRSGRGVEIGSKEWKEFRKELVARAAHQTKI